MNNIDCSILVKRNKREIVDNNNKSRYQTTIGGTNEMETLKVTNVTMHYLIELNKKNSNKAYKHLNLLVNLMEILERYPLEDIVPIKGGVSFRLKSLPKVDVLIDWKKATGSLEEARIEKGYSTTRKKFLYKNNCLFIVPSEQLEKHDYIKSQVRSFINLIAKREHNKEFYELYLIEDPLL
ncbi:hypothetical protein [Aquibacillus sediminis]|uniref:hypothetical protein n=1 Tax=Aquibacillus sediminis TaxID=2574734 RepID=UPI001109597C|nr:hypothetical protein [Aquibacillus sediminis]